MTKPMKPQKMWAVVDKNGRVDDVYMHKEYAEQDVECINNAHPHFYEAKLAPATVRRVLVTEIRRKK